MPQTFTEVHLLVRIDLTDAERSETVEGIFTDPELLRQWQNHLEASPGAAGNYQSRTTTRHLDPPVPPRWWND